MDVAFQHQYKVKGKEITLNERHVFKMVKIGITKYNLHHQNISLKLKFGEHVNQAQNIIDRNREQQELSCHQWNAQLKPIKKNNIENLDQWVYHDLDGFRHKSGIKLFYFSRIHQLFFHIFRNHRCKNFHTFSTHY